MILTGFMFTTIRLLESSLNIPTEEGRGLYQYELYFAPSGNGTINDSEVQDMKIDAPYIRHHGPHYNFTVYLPNKYKPFKLTMFKDYDEDGITFTRTEEYEIWIEDRDLPYSLTQGIKLNYKLIK